MAGVWRGKVVMAPAEDGQQPLHMLFFPYLIPGHLIPMADIAALFAARGVRCTILTSHHPRASFHPPLHRRPPLSVPHQSTSPSCLSLTSVSRRAPRAAPVVTMASSNRRRGCSWSPSGSSSPTTAGLDAVVSDSFFPWLLDVAAEYGVPRLAFLGTSMFARCCAESMLRNHNPDDGDEEGDPDAVFSVPGLPHRVELRRSQMMRHPDQLAFVKGIYAADQKSYGELANSFHELEPDYVENYRTTLRRRAWLVGPVALASGSKDEASRGTDALSPDADGCIPWLDAKPAGSVVFVAFGTLTSFSPEQLQELARGLDLSGKNFVWVISDADAASSDKWMPEGFRRASRGYIIHGWAPQMLILNHPAVGGFLTHCGWNSTLEAVSAGVPMVTWPRHADQFFNEKLVVDVLQVGVSVGAKDYVSSMETHRVIGAEVIAGAVRTLMEVQGDAMPSRARNLGLKARSAVEKGGSSYSDVGHLVDELMARRSRQPGGGL